MSVIRDEGKPKRRKYLQVGFIGVLLLLVMLLAIQLPFDVEEQQRAEDVPTHKEEIIRAQGFTDQGRLIVVAVENEKSRHWELLAASVSKRTNRLPETTSYDIAIMKLRMK